jgi:sirohydrochlorin cobaltochelatase
VLFSHGSLEPGWVRPLERLRRMTARRLPGTEVRLAFLERIAPDLPTLVRALYERGVRRIRVVPVFVAPGGHLRRDLPGIARDLESRMPGLALTLTRATGEATAVLEATAAWIARSR